MKRRIKNYKLKDFLLSAKEKSVALFMIFSLLFCLVILGYWQFSIISNRRPKNVQGKIIDKITNVSETERGSKISRRLILEGQNQERFEISVGVDEFENFKIGNKIKTDENSRIIKLDN